MEIEQTKRSLIIIAVNNFFFLLVKRKIVIIRFPLYLYFVMEIKNPFDFFLIALLPFILILYPYLLQDMTWKRKEIFTLFCFH